MILYPAIELRGTDLIGQEALDDIRRFEDMGFERIYVIDRDAQFLGKPFNTAATQTIMKATRLPAWVGGGIRDIETIRTLLGMGVDRVILGPMFWQREGALLQAAQAFPGKIVVLVDALSGYVAGDSAQGEKKRVLDVALAFERMGIAGIVYMEHDREGAHPSFHEGSLDTELIADLAFALTIPLYVTGGINSMADLRALKAEASTGIEGVILGRALVDGRIDPITALALLKTEDRELS